MHDSQDALQLKAWSSDRCERSFRSLVQRHLGMVYALALRRLGNSAQAGEVAQNVFLALAGKAGRLRTDTPLSPWLHRCTMIECADQIRRESRRLDAMKRYFEHVQNDGPPDADPWREIVPHLDQAVDTLAGSDRAVIIMRYYQQLSYNEIGAALGKSSRAAQKQGERALDRICRSLRKRGVVSPAAVLTAGFAAHVKAAADPALASLAAQITGKAFTSTAASLTLTQTLLSTLMNSTTRTALITTAVLAVPLAWKWQQTTSLSQEVAELRQKVQTTGPVAAARSSGSGGNSKTAPSSIRENGVSPARAGAAWEKALLESDPIERQRKISELIGQLTPQSAPEVLAAFARLKEKGLSFDSEKMLFLRAWGRLDGAAVMAALKGSADFPPGDSFACAALAGWAGNDIAGARAYVESISDPQRKAELTYGLIDGWASTDFDAAAAYVASAPRSTERDRFRELLLARAFSTGGPEGAQKFFAGIPADEHNQLYRQHAFEDVTRLLMTRDPAMAREWLARQEHAGLINPGVLAMAGAGDPQGALNWIDSLKAVDAKTTSQAASNVVSHWAQTDPTAATAWMNSQTGRADRDALVSAMAKSVGYTETEGAVKWAQTINDPEQRQQTLDSVIRKSMRRDPERAPAELAALGISADEIEEAQARSPVSGGVISTRVMDAGGFSGGGATLTYSTAGSAGGPLEVRAVPVEAPRTGIVIDSLTSSLAIGGTGGGSVE